MECEAKKNVSIATEVIQELKRTMTHLFIVIIVLIICLIVSWVGFFWYISLPIETTTTTTTTTTYDATTDDDSSIIFNEGDFYGGKSKGNQDYNNHNN